MNDEAKNEYRHKWAMERLRNWRTCAIHELAEAVEITDIGINLLLNRYLGQPESQNKE